MDVTKLVQDEDFLAYLRMLGFLLCIIALLIQSWMIAFVGAVFCLFSLGWFIGKRVIQPPMGFAR